MGYVTACLQVTARAQSLPLDAMRIHVEVTDKEFEQMRRAARRWHLRAQPLHGGRALGQGRQHDRRVAPKELHPTMPVMHVLGVTQDKEVTQGVYQCPVYMTSIRRPAFTFQAPLRTQNPASEWILAAVCLLFQPDQ